MYAEICANIDRRNTVQEHIFSHIENFVCIHARLIDGEVCIKAWWFSAEWQPVAESDVELYVHPRTGILMRNRHRKGRVAKVRARRAAQANELLARRRILSESEQLHRVDGVWYHVDLAPLPECNIITWRDGNKVKQTAERPKRWDALLNEHLAARDTQGRWSDEPVTMYGRHGVYAISKRQLSERELRQHGLKQKGREISRPFCFRPPRQLLRGENRSQGNAYCLERGLLVELGVADNALVQAFE